MNRSVTSHHIKEISDYKFAPGDILPVDIKDLSSVEVVHHFPLSQVDSDYRVHSSSDEGRVERGGRFVNQVRIPTHKGKSGGDLGNPGLREEKLIFGVVVDHGAIVNVQSAERKVDHLHTIEVIGGSGDSVIVRESFLSVAEDDFPGGRQRFGIPSNDFSSTGGRRHVQILSGRIEHDGEEREFVVSCDVVKVERLETASGEVKPMNPNGEAVGESVQNLL